MASLGPSMSGLTMSLLSEVMPNPQISASAVAPRALAWAADSSTSTPAPSASTVPLRFLANGKQPSGESTCIACHAFMVP
jgi:hypothetical protein